MTASYIVHPSCIKVVQACPLVHENQPIKVMFFFQFVASDFEMRCIGFVLDFRARKFIEVDFEEAVK